MKNRLPKICWRKDRNLAFVTLDGARVYLGEYGAAAQAEYKKVLADYLCGAPKIRRDAARPTVAELASAFLAHEKTYYDQNDVKTT